MPDSGLVQQLDWGALGQLDSVVVIVDSDTSCTSSSYGFSTILLMSRATRSWSCSSFLNRLEGRIGKPRRLSDRRR